MTDPWLDEAVKALRETTGGQSERSSSTRARVLQGLDRGSAGRRRWVWLLPAVAILGGGTALAANSQTTARWLGEAGQWLGLAAAPSQREPAPSARAAPRRVHSVKRPASVEPTSSTPEPPPSAEAAPPPAPPRAAVPAKPSEPESRPEPHLQLYRAAHEAHFRDRDFATALAGWDSYLLRAPSGSFAMEARYNRAIALVRLGRSAAARAALEPFAEGRHGGYRQADARKLLDAMPTASTEAVVPAGLRDE